MTQSPSIPLWLHRKVVRRARNRCEYCRLPQALCPVPLQIDHIRPRSKRGPSDYKNLSLACPVCNNGKRAHTTGEDPKTGLQVRLFNPRAQRWRAHFRWSEDFSTILGRTAVGRATISRLRMNRPFIAQFRRLMAKRGLFQAG
jgi:hypothetical protein